MSLNWMAISFCPPAVFDENKFLCVCLCAWLCFRARNNSKYVFKDEALWRPLQWLFRVLKCFWRAHFNCCCFESVFVSSSFYIVARRADWNYFFFCELIFAIEHLLLHEIEHGFDRCRNGKAVAIFGYEYFRWYMICWAVAYVLFLRYARWYIENGKYYSCEYTRDWISIRSVCDDITRNEYFDWVEICSTRVHIRRIQIRFIDEWRWPKKM